MSAIDPKLFEIVTPIMDRHKGRRMEYMRKMLFLDQTELAQLLGTNQQAVSRLERGRIPVTRVPIPISKFYEVFGALTEHILFNNGDFDYGFINGQYWSKKDKPKGNRTIRKPYRKLRRG